MNSMLKAAIGLVLAVAGSAAQSATVFSAGAGSAVTSVDASADFESTAALTNGYVEDGLLFALSANLCGYAGCTYHTGFYGGATPFSGNYLYGYNIGQIEATGGNVFHGLELTLGTGYGGNVLSISWATYLGGTLVGSGSTGSLSGPAIYGWYDADGFDRLVFSDPRGYAAMDSVRAQYAVSAVPIPAAGVLLLGAIGGLGVVARRRKPA